MLLEGKIESQMYYEHSNKIHLSFHMVMFKSMQENQFKTQKN